MSTPPPSRATATASSANLAATSSPGAGCHAALAGAPPRTAEMNDAPNA